MGDTLTVGAVAARYGVKDHTVLTWIHSGELRAVNVARRAGGGRPSWRIPAAALEAFEALRTPTRRPGRKPRKAKPAGVISFY